MKTTLFTAAALVAVASAQLSHDEKTGEFICAKPDGAYCAGDSLGTNIIVRCSGTKGQPGNCNDNLAGIPPVGVKSAALCYQSSETAGDAACSFEGKVYPSSGEPFDIPSASGTPSGSGYPSGTASATDSETDSPTGTETATEEPTGSGYPTGTDSATATETDIETETETESATGYPTDGATETADETSAAATPTDGGAGKGNDTKPTVSEPAQPTSSDSAANSIKIVAELAMGAMGLAAWFML